MRGACTVIPRPYTRCPMPRSMWRGAISFGMVAIPVRLYLATELKSVSFRLLCPNDHTPVRNKRWCPEEDREIGWSEALRGYEVGKDEYVIVTDADLDELPLTTTHTIEIVEFCPDFGDRSRGLSQERVLPGAGERRRQAVRAAPRGAGEDRNRRHRQDRAPRPGAPLPSCAPRGGPAAQHPALAGRDPLDG